MSTPRLIWNNDSPDAGKQERVDFVFSPGVGLTDMDFHPVNAQGWEFMKSPSADAVAALTIPETTTALQMEEMLQLIAAKGGYHTILVIVRKK